MDSLRLRGRPMTSWKLLAGRLIYDVLISRGASDSLAASSVFVNPHACVDAPVDLHIFPG